MGHITLGGGGGGHGDPGSYIVVVVYIIGGCFIAGLPKGNTII